MIESECAQKDVIVPPCAWHRMECIQHVEKTAKRAMQYQAIEIHRNEFVGLVPKQWHYDCDSLSMQKMEIVFHFCRKHLT